MGNIVAPVLKCVFYLFLFYLKRSIMVGYYSLYALFQDDH